MQFTVTFVRNSLKRQRNEIITFNILSASLTIFHSPTTACFSFKANKDRWNKRLQMSENMSCLCAKIAEKLFENTRKDYKPLLVTEADGFRGTMTLNVCIVSHSFWQINLPQTCLFLFFFSCFINFF